ncbi:hypothetical protein F2Q69_00062263 [Brassica cretica]|uniref:Acyl-CoA-binding domain-containing protein n=1 Tax=Brassica cretica TaxID=69181 RepID=A0A8S9RE23_BRACR|nr:hypothetical protein F2Q69_00062263 [Brassica cretica]
MISSAGLVDKAVFCHSTLKKWRVHGNQLLFLDDRNSEIYGFIPAGRRYHKGSVHQCVELRYEITGLPFYHELQSAESLAAEQSRCFKLEVAEVRQKIKTMETLENKLELLHRQRAVASEQAAANMNGKRQSSGSVWGWLAGTLPPKA